MPAETVLIACADASEAAFLAGILDREGYRCLPAAGRAEVIHHVETQPPDLLLLDADLDATIVEIIPELHVRNRDLGVLTVLWETDREGAQKAARMGILDFITKPFDRDKIPIRLAVAAERRRQIINDRLYKLALEKRINVRTQEVWDKKERLRQQLLSTIEALAQTLAAKHAYTEGHSRRVTNVAVAVARAAGLASAEINVVELAARFHDIGKIGIRDEVLNKPGRLDDAEYEHVKLHPLIAEQILAPIEDFAVFLPLVKHEHERYDGKGYPSGLKGEEIPLGARIIAIADAYDALVSDRAYRRGCTAGEALAEIQRCAGSQFDPHLVDLFARLVREGAIAAMEGRGATLVERPAAGRPPA